jgi:general L-amino acid transport system substrate-binding protein
MLKRWILAAFAAFGLAAAPAVAASPTLSAVKSRGVLNCGVSTGLIGFSAKDAAGAWSGFDVDFCRALAAAVLGDAARVTFVPLSAAERFDALRSGSVDLLSRNTTWTLDREASLGLLFGAITYYDGQGFMVARKPGVESALQLGGSRVCVQSGTTSQLNLADYFRANSMTYLEVAFPTSTEALAGLESGACDVLTTDQSALFAERLRLKDPSIATILPDVISKEPLGPVVRADDVAWFNIVKWTAFALINAEELGIMRSTLPTARSIAAAREAGGSAAAAGGAAPRPEVLRFVGAEGDLGPKLGLSPSWALDAVEAAGNYAEIYDRNVGASSPLGIPRGMNQLWSMGGILYAPPMR